MKRKLFTLLALSCIAFSSCSGSWEYIPGGNQGENVESLSISEVEANIKIGDTKTIYAACEGADQVKWVLGGDINAVSVVYNELNAIVTGMQTGIAYLRAIAGDKSEMCKIVVTASGTPSTITVNSVSFNETNKLLNEGEQFLLTATINSIGGTPALSWTSSNNVAISMVKQSNTQAIITGLADGTAVVTASAGGKSASCTFTVSKNDSGVSISLNKSSLSLEEGKGFGLVASTSPADAEVTWASNNPAVASVNNSGYVSALSAGQATISATINVSGEIKSATCGITVTAQGGSSEYDEQIAAWSKPGHLYMHYLRTSDSDYDRWALWIWNSYPIDAEGTLWGANPTTYDLKGITPTTVGWMKDELTGQTYSDEFGQVIDVDLTREDLVDGRYGYPSPFVKNWDKADEEDLGFLIVDQSKMTGKDMWVSDGGAETYIEGFGKYMNVPEGGSYKDAYLHVYCVEGAVSDFKVTSGKQTVINPTATDTTGGYRSQNDITDLRYDAYPNGVETSRTFLKDRPGTGYQIFVASFCDSNNDGYGDIQGIISKLDYLQDLGIEVLWLTPIQQSNSYHGYDVTDYYKIDPRFGTLQDYQELLYKAHQRGMKVLMDMVINHTSKSNVLYKKSQKAEVETLPNGKTINYRDMYLWKYQGDYVREWDGVEKPSDWDKTHPNQTWTANFVNVKVEENKDWYRDGTSNYFYYGKFGSGMAELNYASSATREYMTEMCKYWLSFGLDGFRLDAIKHIFLLGELDPSMAISTGDDVVYDVGYKEYYSPEILDDQGKPALQRVKNDYSYDRKLNVMFWKQFAGTIKSAYPNCFLVGENYDGWNKRIAPFYEAIDSQFDFSTYYHLNESTAYESGITAMGGDILATLNYNKDFRGNHINGAFTSNHDTFRLMNHAVAQGSGAHHAEVNTGNYDTAIQKARWFAAATILTPGVSWIYYGDEIGMTGNLMDPVYDSKGKLVNDPNDPDTVRDNNKDRWYRQPMKWTDTLGGETPKYQFGGNEVLWDNVTSSTRTVNANSQHAAYKAKDYNNMFSFFASACHVKNDDRYPTYGYVTNQWGNGAYLALQLSDGSRSAIAYINASGYPIEIEYQNRGREFIGGSVGASQTQIPAYGFSVVAL